MFLKLFEEVLDVMRSVDSLNDAPDSVDTEAVTRVLDGFPVKMAFLFGSFGKDEATELSDVDVAVLFESDVPEDGKVDLRDRLTAELISEISFDAVDLLDLSRASPEVAYDAVSNGVLLKGSRKEAARFEEQMLSKKLDFQHVKEEWRNNLSKRIEEGDYGRA